MDLLFDGRDAPLMAGECCIPEGCQLVRNKADDHSRNNKSVDFKKNAASNGIASSININR
ncbi:hypothetical protein ACVSQB_05165 [Bradyrhizobium elkanii]